MSYLNTTLNNEQLLIEIKPYYKIVLNITEHVYITKCQLCMSSCYCDHIDMFINLFSIH